MGNLVVFKTGRGSRAQLSTVQPIVFFHKAYITFSQGALGALGIKEGTRILLAQDVDKPSEILISVNPAGEPVTKQGADRMTLHRSASINSKLMGRYKLNGKSEDHKDWFVLVPVAEGEEWRG